MTGSARVFLTRVLLPAERLRSTGLFAFCWTVTAGRTTTDPAYPAMALSRHYLPPGMPHHPPERARAATAGCKAKAGTSIARYAHRMTIVPPPALRITRLLHTRKRKDARRKVYTRAPTDHRRTLTADALFHRETRIHVGRAARS